MKYYVEESLSNFEFWGGGKDRAKLLTEDQFDAVEQMLEEIAPEEGWSDTAINDMFWFEYDFIARMLGYEDWNALEHGEEEEEE